MRAFAVLCSLAILSLAAAQCGGFTYNGACVPSCPVGTVAEGDECVACDETCETCFHRSVCLTCKSGFALDSENTCVECPQFIHDGQCVEGCPAGTATLSAGRECIQCAEGCSECFRPSVCTACKPGFMLNEQMECVGCPYFVHNGLCVDSCPDGTTFEGNDNVCVDCDETCATCFHPGVCLTCKPGFTLNDQNVCVPSGAARCDSFTCTNGWTPITRVNRHNIACPRGECSNRICCNPPTCANANGGSGYQCASPLVLRADAARVQCNGQTSSGCNQRICCVRA